MKKVTLDYIEIEWEGPKSLKEVLENEKTVDENFGLYQIYGDHAIYGRDTLLYIGKTKRAIAERFREHSDWLPYEQSSAKIYLGRLGDNKYEKTEKDKMIGMAESLLIYYCAPSYNARGISYKSLEGIDDLIVLNYGSKAMLPYELSTLYERSEYVQELIKKSYSELLGMGE